MMKITLDKFQSNPCLHENNNALVFDEYPSYSKKSSNRLVQSSTDIQNLDRISSSTNRKTRAIRIESALLTSDYSHSLKYLSQSRINIKHNGAGDENHSNYINDKQIRTDHTHYLTLEQVPLSNQRTIQLTTKQILSISLSVFILVTLLCLGIISLFF